MNQVGSTEDISSCQVTMYDSSLLQIGHSLQQTNEPSNKSIALIISISNLVLILQ